MTHTFCPAIQPISPWCFGAFPKSSSSTLSLWLYSQRSWNQASLAHPCPRAAPAIPAFQQPASWLNHLLFISMDLSSFFLQSSNFVYSVLQTPLPDWLFPQPVNLISAQKTSLPVQSQDLLGQQFMRRCQQVMPDCNRALPVTAQSFLLVLS